MRKPTLVAALVADNDGNRRGNLFGSDVKSRRVRAVDRGQGFSERGLSFCLAFEKNTISNLVITNLQQNSKSKDP